MEYTEELTRGITNKQAEKERKQKANEKINKAEINLKDKNATRKI
jgi:hypothetical protein